MHMFSFPKHSLLKYNAAREKEKNIAMILQEAFQMHIK